MEDLPEDSFRIVTRWFDRSEMPEFQERLRKAIGGLTAEEVMDCRFNLEQKSEAAAKQK